MDTSKRSGLRTKKGWRSIAAFSLVEVTLAIGVFGFAFTAIVGLIPMGLTTFRQAMDASVGSQICQRVINDAQQTDFDVLTSSSNANIVRYFDDAGNELSTPAKAIYHVKTVVTGTPPLPGTTGFASLATVFIQIANNPANQTIPTDPTNASAWKNDPRFSITTYSGLVSQNK